MSQPSIHPTADVSPRATVGADTRIWHHVQVREGARIGRNCILGKGVYVDADVVMLDNVKVQNGCSLYRGATIEDGVFLGPGVILTNDKLPRATKPDGSLKTELDWELGRILVRRGASLGAGVLVLPDVTIGAFAMIGAGTVVTRDVPDYGLAVGNPASLIGFVCHCGTRLHHDEPIGCSARAACARCGASITVPLDAWRLPA